MEIISYIHTHTRIYTCNNQISHRHTFPALFNFPWPSKYDSEISRLANRWSTPFNVFQGLFAVTKRHGGSHETPIPMETRPEEFKVQSLTGAFSLCACVCVNHFAASYDAESTSEFLWRPDADLSVTPFAGNQQRCSGGVFVLLTHFLRSAGCFPWLLVFWSAVRVLVCSSALW